MPSPNHILPIHYLFFILFTITINQSNSARNLDHPKHNAHHHHHQQISFSMPHILTQTRPLSSKQNDQTTLPFSKPLGYFPPIGGIPYPNTPLTRAQQPRTLELAGLTMSFPTSAALQELKLGTVTTINEDVYTGPVFAGRAEGVYVASSEDGSSHLMAMTTSFVKSEGDGLRYFGVLKNDGNKESHLTVIGGTGKYHGANGYATVKTQNISGHRSSKSDEDNGSYKTLLFNVFLG